MINKRFDIHPLSHSSCCVQPSMDSKSQLTLTEIPPLNLNIGNLESCKIQDFFEKEGYGILYRTFKNIQKQSTQINYQTQFEDFTQYESKWKLMLNGCKPIPEMIKSQSDNKFSSFNRSIEDHTKQLSENENDLQFQLLQALYHKNKLYSIHASISQFTQNQSQLQKPLTMKVDEPDTCSIFKIYDCYKKLFQNYLILASYFNRTKLGSRAKNAIKHCYDQFQKISIQIDEFQNIIPRFLQFILRCESAMDPIVNFLEKLGSK